MGWGWQESGFGSGMVGPGVPLPPANDPAGYMAWLLQYQEPLGNPLAGIALNPSNLWLFGKDPDSLTDLVAGEVLAISGTVPLTAFSDVPETSVELTSPLMTGFARLDAVGDALTAATASVGDILTSALIVWCSRYPTTPGAPMATVSKREAVADFVGFEDSINALGERVTTLDYGAAANVHALADNYTAELPAGAWHWHGILVDAQGGASGRTMIATDAEITPWIAMPVGSLSNAIALSIGAGRLQALEQDIAVLALFMGAQVENLFNSPTENSTDGNDPKGPNIRDQVCMQLATNTTRFVATSVTV